MKTKPIDRFLLSKEERAALAMLSKISKRLRTRLPEKGSKFTVAHAANLVAAVANELLSAGLAQQIALIAAARSVANTLVGSTKAVRVTQAELAQLFHFKITLNGNANLSRRVYSARTCVTCRVPDL